MFVTRPDAFVSFILNTMVGNCLSFKIQAENLLRQSGLNYVIVRPGGLPGNKEMLLEQESEAPNQQPFVEQGDKGHGHIHRTTVGKVIAENLISNRDLPEKLTFELMANPINHQDYQSLPIEWKSLQSDTPASIVEVDHVAGRISFRNRLICKIFFALVCIFAIIYLLFF